MGENEWWSVEKYILWGVKFALPFLQSTLPLSFYGKSNYKKTKHLWVKTKIKL